MEKAYILISCELGKENELLSQLKQIEEISNVIITYGDYDMVAEVETENAQNMDKIIISKIRKFDKIRSTITLRVTC